jgi:hypothetical protein
MSLLPPVVSGAKVTSRFFNSIANALNAGMKIIAPTSVDGASSPTMSPLGKVTFSGEAIGVGIRGCITDAYEEYLIKIDAVMSTNSGINVQLALGAGELASGYDSQVIVGVGTSTPVSNQVLGAGFWTIGAASQTRHTIKLELYAPDRTRTYAPTPVLGTATAAATNVPMTSSAAVAIRQLTQSNTFSYDGLFFFPTSGTMSGVIRVYGLAYG